MNRMLRFNSELELTLEKLFFLLVSNFGKMKTRKPRHCPTGGVTRIGKAMCTKHLEQCLLSDLQHLPFQPLGPPFMCCFLWG